MAGSHIFESYASRLAEAMALVDWRIVDPLAAALFEVWKTKRQVFLAGNGGSAANCNHIVNDFVYPVSKVMGKGVTIRSLAESPAVLSCLANDEGYENIFSTQLSVFSNPGDVLWVMSGYGNSENIIRVLKTAKEIGVTSYAVLGFDGGKARELADNAIHFPIFDMQIAEDLQMVVGHMLVQYLFSRRSEIN